MNCRKLYAPAFFVTLGVAAVVATTFALAEESKDAGQSSAQPAAAKDKPEMKLPPGWTEADMQACAMAGTPGEQHKRMAREAGVWMGKNSMWMPGVPEPMKAESTTTVTPIMEGRFIKVEVKGEMPGMGPFEGFGINGFDNVTGKYVSTWIDNMGTGIMNGTGELSKDGKTMTWNYTANCPITKKAVAYRQVEKTTGADTKTLEMFGPDPKSGKEFKMLSIELTRKGGQARAAATKR
jgi:hypothetical protein